jgi:hypothetical protein
VGVGVGVLRVVAREGAPEGRRDVERVALTVAGHSEPLLSMRVRVRVRVSVCERVSEDGRRVGGGGGLGCLRWRSVGLRGGGRHRTTADVLG